MSTKKTKSKPPSSLRVRGACIYCGDSGCYAGTACVDFREYPALPETKPCRSCGKYPDIDGPFREPDFSILAIPKHRAKDDAGRPKIVDADWLPYAKHNHEFNETAYDVECSHRDCPHAGNAHVSFDVWNAPIHPNRMAQEPAYLLLQARLERAKKLAIQLLVGLGDASQATCDLVKILTEDEL